MSRRARSQALEKQEMESVWKDRLKRQSWSESAIQSFVNQWAPSTRRQYNSQINWFRSYLQQRSICVLSVQESQFVSFLEHVASTSSRPKTVLSSMLTAINHFYKGLGCKSPVSDNVRHFVKALVKSATAVPIAHSTVFPVHHLRWLFHTWGAVDRDLDKLRMKTLALWALTPDEWVNDGETQRGQQQFHKRNIPTRLKP